MIISVDAIFLKTGLIFMLCNLINTINTVFNIIIFLYYITNLILQKVTPGMLKSRVNLCQSQFFNSVQICSVIILGRITCTPEGNSLNTMKCGG